MESGVSMTRRICLPVLILLLISFSPAFAQSVALSPALLSFTGTAGATNPTPQTISVTATVGWTISVATDDGSNWLSVSPASGSGNATVSVSVNAAGLAGGAHNANLTLTTAGGSSTARVYAQMCSPQVIVTPSAMVFTAGTIPGVNALSVSSTGCSNTPALFPATVSVSTKDGGNWLSAPPGPGGLTFVVPNPNGLAAGLYNGAVTLTFANGATASTTVTLIVGKQAFVLSPQALQFLSRPGGPNPPSQSVSVSFPTASTPPPWTVSATSDIGNWLSAISAIPASGSGSGTIQLFVNKNGLSPGIYYGTVTVNAGTAGTTQASVALVVLGNTSTTYTDSYYFPHLVVGGGWQTTITYVNYSPQNVYCQINFHSDLGDSLRIPLTPNFTVPGFATVIEAGGTFHEETQSDPNTPLLEGWADAQCSGPVKPSLLFRLYSGGAAVSEASVGAAVPASAFSTFAQIGQRGSTGFAFANISTTTQATLTLTAFDSGGQMVATRNLSLGPRSHSAVTADQLFIGLASFIGSVRITSSVPIIALALNLEANPVFSSLPPAELPAVVIGSRVAYYFPHLVFGGGWQTTLTYVNDFEMNTCRTGFYSDSGAPLSLSFSDQSGTTRTDMLNSHGTVHQETQAALDAPLVEGWAQVTCDSPVKASLLFRFYNSQGAVSEAGVNATVPFSEFATFAKTGGKGITGIAFANPSTDLPATITVIGLNPVGLPLSNQAPATLVLQPRSHIAVTVDKLPGLLSLFSGGSVQIVSTTPIVALSLNFEDAPSFSSLPPAELPDSTPMATATGP
jgi:Viral BACON domain